MKKGDARFKSEHRSHLAACCSLLQDELIKHMLKHVRQFVTLESCFTLIASAPFLLSIYLQCPSFRDEQLGNLQRNGSFVNQTQHLAFSNNKLRKPFSHSTARAYKNWYRGLDNARVSAIRAAEEALALFIPISMAEDLSCRDLFNNEKAHTVQRWLKLPF